MATPTVEEVLSDEDSDAPASVATAAGTAVGDLLLAVGVSDFYELASFGPPTPGTWTLVESVGPDDAVHMRVWVREVTSAGSQTVSLDPINDEDVGLYVYRLSGADDTTPVDDSDSTNGTTASTSHVAPSIAPDSEDALLIAAWATGNGAYTDTPESMTGRAPIDGDPFYEAIAADEALEASGSTGTRTATFDASRPWVAISLAVQGEAAGGVTGTLAATEGADTLAATGTHTPPPISGTVAATEADDTLAASGTHTPPSFTGTAAVTEAADALAAGGTAAPPAFTGTASVTEQADTMDAAGTVAVPSFSGAVAATEALDSLAAAGAVVNPGVAGSLTATEAPDSLAAAGSHTVPAFTGTLAVTEASDTLAAAGAVVNEGIAGSLSVTEAVDTLVAVGAAEEPPAVLPVSATRTSTTAVAARRTSDATATATAESDATVEG